MDWVSATAFLTPSTLIGVNVYPTGASVRFHTEAGDLSISVAQSDEAPIPAATLHDLLTRAALMLETETLIAIEAQRTPTPMNGEVAQAIVDGTMNISGNGTGGIVGTVIPAVGDDECKCPDQEHHAAWCWKQRTEVGAVQTEDEAR